MSACIEMSAVVTRAVIIIIIFMEADSNVFPSHDFLMSYESSSTPGNNQPTGQKIKIDSRVKKSK